MWSFRKMEKRSGMSVRQSIGIVAGTYEGNRKSWLARVPRKVSTVTFRTVKALWYGEIAKPDEHWAARDIRRAADVIEARKEAAALADQYQNIIGGLRASDADFYSAEIARLERIARILGGQDST
jgi:hypothetical protein